MIVWYAEPVNSQPTNGLGGCRNQRDEWAEALRLFSELGASNHAKRAQSQLQKSS